MAMLNRCRFFFFLSISCRTCIHIYLISRGPVHEVHAWWLEPSAWPAPFYNPGLFGFGWRGWLGERLALGRCCGWWDGQCSSLLVFGEMIGARQSWGRGHRQLWTALPYENGEEWSGAELAGGRAKGQSGWWGLIGGGASQGKGLLMVDLMG